MEPNTGIFSRMLAGGIIDKNDPDLPKIWKIVAQTITLSSALNTATDTNQIRIQLSKIIGSAIDTSTIVFVPFHTNFGKHTAIGKNVFIGANSVILPGVKVGDDSIIGAGSVVTKDVIIGGRVKGNPAKLF